MWPACDDFDEIASSSTNFRSESNGNTLPEGAAAGDALGDVVGGGVAGIGKATATPAPRIEKTRKPLASALFAGCGSSALAFFDKLLDSLATFLSDAFVEVWTVAIARGFATFLSTLLTDLLVEFVTVCLLCG